MLQLKFMVNDFVEIETVRENRKEPYIGKVQKIIVQREQVTYLVQFGPDENYHAFTEKFLKRVQVIYPDSMPQPAPAISDSDKSSWHIEPDEVVF